MSLSDEMTAVLHFDFQESAKVLRNKPISLVQSEFLELTDSQSRVPLHKLGNKECETSALSDFEGKEWVFPRVAIHLHGNSSGTPHIRLFIYSLQEL